MNRIILLTYTVFLLQSCSSENNENTISLYKKENAEIFKDSLTLVKQTDVSFPLDSSTPLSSNSIHLYQNKDGNKYLSLINDYNGTIYIYNQASGKLEKQIKLATDGPNGVGVPAYIAHHIIDFDSIVIVNNWDHRIYMINQNGIIAKKLTFPQPDDKKLTVGLGSSTQKPIITINNQIYLIGHLLTFGIDDYSKLNNVIRIDRDFSRSIRFLPRPDINNNGTWSGWQFDLFGTLNTHNQKLVFSFAADPNVYETDLNGVVQTKHYISSKYFKEIPPFSRDKLTTAEVDKNIPKLEKHDYITPRFAQIIYDRFNNLYYRFCLLPESEQQYANPQTRKYQEQSIIISDSNFKKVGEVILPNKKLNTKMYFITNEGLHIAHLPEVQKNENLLTFSLFNIQKK